MQDCTKRELKAKYIIYNGNNLYECINFDKSNLSSMSEITIDGTKWVLYYRDAYKSGEQALRPVPIGNYIIKFSISKHSFIVSMTEKEFKKEFEDKEFKQSDYERYGAVI